jgi:hypothetical protein
MIGYEQSLGRKAGSIGCRVLSEKGVSRYSETYTRQLHFQYANGVKGLDGSFLYGFRAGFGDEGYKPRSGRGFESGIGIYSSLGVALSLQHVYMGLGILNFHSSALLSKSSLLGDAPTVVSLQTAGFIEVNPYNPRVFIVPSFDLDIDADEGAQASLKLNVASPHLTGGAGIVIREGLSAEVKFGYMTKRFRIGYSFGCPMDIDGASSDNTIFELHLAYFLANPKEEDTDNLAYCFRHLF